VLWYPTTRRRAAYFVSVDGIIKGSGRNASMLPGVLKPCIYLIVETGLRIEVATVWANIPRYLSHEAEPVDLYRKYQTTGLPLKRELQEIKPTLPSLMDLTVESALASAMARIRRNESVLVLIRLPFSLRVNEKSRCLGFFLCSLWVAMAHSFFFFFFMPKTPVI